MNLRYLPAKGVIVGKAKVRFEENLDFNFDLDNAMAMFVTNYAVEVELDTRDNRYDGATEVRMRYLLNRSGSRGTAARY